MAENPYAAPKSRVDDTPPTFVDGDFIAEGRAVAAGNGWRWIADAWTFTGLQRLMFIGVFVICAVLWIVVSLIPILGAFAPSLMFPLLYGGGVIGCEALRRGGRLEIDHLFAGFQHHTGRLLALGGISIGLGLIFAVIMAAIVGFGFLGVALGVEEPNPQDLEPLLRSVLLAVLVILALSLPFAMAMWFAPPLVVLGQLDVPTALKTSFFACLKNVLPFLVWSVMMLLLALVASIPLFLGWLLLGPVYMASVYLSYRDIFYVVDSE